MNHETDIISTNLFLILYYITVITFFCIGGIVYTPAENTLQLPSTAVQIQTPFEIGVQIISLPPTLALALLILISPVFTAARSFLVKTRAELKNLLPASTFPLATFAASGILLPQITCLAAAYISPKIGMIALLPQITLHGNIISVCTILAVAGYLIPFLTLLVKDIRDRSKNGETEK